VATEGLVAARVVEPLHGLPNQVEGVGTTHRSGNAPQDRRPEEPARVGLILHLLLDAYQRVTPGTDGSRAS
jgi:hypothetical protein